MEKLELTNVILDLKISKSMDKYSLVCLLDLPRMKDIGDLEKNIDENSIYIFIANDSPKALAMGEMFDVLVPLNNPDNYIKTPILIKFFSMNKKLEIEKLYGGFSAIALLEFPEGIPSIIHEMQEYMSQNKDNAERFYLMNKDLWNEIVNWKR
jgi:hypothetical protein